MKKKKMKAHINMLTTAALYFVELLHELPFIFKR